MAKKMNQKQLMTWKTSMKRFLKQLDALRGLIKGLARGTAEFVVEGTDNAIDNAVIAGLDEILDELPPIQDKLVPFVDSVTESGQMKVLNYLKSFFNKSGLMTIATQVPLDQTMAKSFRINQEHILRTDSKFFDKMYSLSHKTPKFIEEADKTVKNVVNQIIEGGQEIMNKIKQHAPIKPKSKPSGGGRSRGSDGRQHPQWYLQNPYNLHTNVNLNNNKSVVLNIKELIDSKNGYFSVPGTIIYRTQTMQPLDPNMGFRKAVEQLYSTLNITQLGSISYTVRDLERYLQLATHSWTVYFDLTRSIRLSSTYLAYDATIQTVFDEYRVSDSDLASVTNLTINFGNWIYTSLPMKGTILDRRELLYSNVFRDSESLNSQFFMFDLGSSVGYDDDDNLITYPIAGSYSEANVISTINQIKAMYTENPNFAIIAGHLIRLFGDSVNNSKYLDKLIKDKNPAYIKISPINFIYDKDVIDQVRNATIDNDYIRFLDGHYIMEWDDPEDTRAQSLNMDVMLGVTHLNELVPGKAESLYRLRHHVTSVKINDDDMYEAIVDACGTEHITGANFYYQAAPDVEELSLSPKRISPVYNTSVAGVLPYTPIAAIAFEAFPLVLCVDAASDGLRVFGILASFNNTILLQKYTYIQAISNGNNSLWYTDMQYKMQNNLISFIK